MLFQQRFLEGIRDGTITLAYRRWRRPTVRAGGTLLTAIGQLEIVSVTEVALDRISAADAQRAGYASREALVTELQERDAGAFFRIELGRVRPDPRIALREAVVSSPGERDVLLEKLKRLDARAPDGPWTQRTLSLIAEHPGVRAGDLCGRMGQEREPFKENVRKLKSLGLTESLEVGYRLSPRGRDLLASLQSAADTPVRPRGIRETPSRLD